MNLGDARNSKALFLFCKIKGSRGCWCVWEQEEAVEGYRQGDEAVDDKQPSPCLDSQSQWMRECWCRDERLEVQVMCVFLVDLCPKTQQEHR